MTHQKAIEHRIEFHIIEFQDMQENERFMQWDSFKNASLSSLTVLEKMNKRCLYSCYATFKGNRGLSILHMFANFMNMLKIVECMIII